MTSSNEFRNESSKVLSNSQRLSERQEKQGIRQSNFELLRIIAIVLIIAHHFSVHFAFDFPNEAISVNRLWLQFIQIGGKIGVNIFVLISGYFLISSKSLKTNKVIKLWLQIFTYSALIFIIFIGLGIQPFGIKTLIKSSFPVIFSNWWFPSTYFVLYLLSPYINRLLNAFDKKSYQRFLMLLMILWCIIPTFTTREFQSNGLIWFVFLYAFAGYIKKYRLKSNIKAGTYIRLAVTIIILTFLSAMFFDILGTKVSFFGDHATYFYEMEKLPIFIISALMFIGFSKIDIGYKRSINLVSSATFGVYLIHDHAFVRSFLWKTVFKTASYSDSNLLIPYSLLVIAIVFVACTIIELARIYILEKNYMNLVNTFSGKVENKLEKFFSLSFFDEF